MQQYKKVWGCLSDKHGFRVFLSEVDAVKAATRHGGAVFPVSNFFTEGQGKDSVEGRSAETPKETPPQAIGEGTSTLPPATPTHEGGTVQTQAVDEYGVPFPLGDPRRTY